MEDILNITLHLAAVCEKLGLNYVVGGSLASSLHGIPRATEDVDLIVEIGQRDVPAFVAAVREDFYLDESAICDAIDRGTSFNLVHLKSYFKADVFVSKGDEPSRLQMARARAYDVGTGSARRLVVASPEDVIAQKLYWYALGDRVSERQWNDALGVLKVAGPRLDLQYLCRISGLLGVEPLLREAAAAVGLELPAAR